MPTAAALGNPPNWFGRSGSLDFGLFAVALLAKERWGDSDTHPAVQTRIDAVRALMDPLSDIAAAIAHLAFAALGAVWPGAPRSA